MKKEDLKKLYNEGSKGLEPAIILGNLLFLFFFITSISFPQIRINGFCRLNNFATFPGYTGFYLTDFNSDSFSDVILFNGTDNNVVTLASTKDDFFSEPKNKFFFFPITAINYFNQKNKNELVHIFVSRKERLAGLVSFTKYGTLKLLNIIRFSTYPSKVITADLNNNGENEAIVFGKTFAGLSLLSADNFILRDTSITGNGTYSDAAFINLDYDDFTDIAAVNMLHNSIDFFYNKGDYNFENERHIDFQSQITNFKATDFNNDSYTDLIFTIGNSFHILLGDSVSSFRKRITINTNSKIFKYVVGDFNSDQQNDLAYVGSSKNKIKIIFGINDSTFSKPVLLFKKNNLNSLQTSANKKIINVFSLSDDGTFSKFTNNSFLPDSFQIPFAGNPGKLLWKIYKNTNKFELSFIDNYDFTFKQLEGSQLIAQKFSQYPISNTFSNIKTFNKRKIEDYLFFNKGELLMEFLQIPNNSTVLKQIYTTNPILDASLIYLKNKKTPLVITVTSNGSSANVTNFKFNDSQFIKLNKIYLDSNVVSANISVGENTVIYYWKAQSDSLKLIKKKLGTKISTTLFKEKIKNDSLGNQITKVKLLENDRLSNAEITSIITQKDNIKILFFKKKKMWVVNLATASLGNKIKNIESARYAYDSKLKQRSFFILANNSTAIFKLDVNKNFKLQSLSKYIESKKVNDYFVTKLFDNYNYIVYTSDNSIKFLRIK